jgi:dephospho-CoA kinase
MGATMDTRVKDHQITIAGLTGGVGMGKSACAQWLRAHAVPSVDTDDLARQIVEPGQPAVSEIRQTFGPQAVDSEGQLRREFLAGQVFSDARARQQLEAILHPRIRTLWREQVAAWGAEGHELAVVVIPLLFETNAEGEFDVTICAACSAITQRQRLLARGWTVQQMERRIAAQFSIDRKMAGADFVVWTEGLLGATGEQLERILQSVRIRAGERRPRQG